MLPPGRFATYSRARAMASAGNMRSMPGCSSRNGAVTSATTWRTKVSGCWASACGLPTFVRMTLPPASLRFTAAA